MKTSTRIAKWVIIVCTMTALLTLAVGYAFDRWERVRSPKIEVREKVVTVVDTTSAEKIEAKKTEVVTTLSTQCEYQGWNESSKPYVIEDNRRGALQVVFGPFQFVPSTVVHYKEVLYSEAITQADAIRCALDWDCSYKLAYDIIWKHKGGIFEWENCARKLDLIKTVEVLKAL